MVAVCIESQAEGITYALRDVIFACYLISKIYSIILNCICWYAVDFQLLSLFMDYFNSAEANLNNDLSNIADIVNQQFIVLNASKLIALFSGTNPIKRLPKLTSKLL